MALWLSNYASRININIYDMNPVMCKNGNMRAKEYGIEKWIKFHCKDVLDIEINNANEFVQHNGIYICWKRSNLTACFALKIYLCAFQMGKQVYTV